MGGKRTCALNPVTILLVAAASMGIMSAAILGGVVPGFVGGVYIHAPTATYQEFLSVNYESVYRFMQVPFCRAGFPHCVPTDQTVFFTNTRNGTIRLVFYCVIIQNSCNMPSQLPIDYGACLRMTGTLIRPSVWPSEGHILKPFDGDLYVFTYSVLPNFSCA